MVIVELIGDCVFEFVPHDDIYYVIEQGIHEGTNMLRVNGSSIYLVDKRDNHYICERVDYDGQDFKLLLSFIILKETLK